MSKHITLINSEHSMEELLNTIEFNILEKENATYVVELPSINWVTIILDNVQTIGDRHLSKEDEIPENLVNIEFVVESDNDYPEEDFFHGAD